MTQGLRVVKFSGLPPAVSLTLCRRGNRIIYVSARATGAQTREHVTRAVRRLQLRLADRRTRKTPMALNRTGGGRAAATGRASQGLETGRIRSVAPFTGDRGPARR